MNNDLAGTPIKWRLSKDSEWQYGRVQYYLKNNYFMTRFGSTQRLLHRKHFTIIKEKKSAG